MRIRSFSADRVHGFMDFDIEFFPDLTFLTGINGSGKTTVVNASSAILSPSLINLVNLEFDRMELAITTDQEDEIAIWARKEEERLVLSASTLDKELEITPITLTLPHHRKEFGIRGGYSLMIIGATLLRALTLGLGAFSY